MQAIQCSQFSDRKRTHLFGGSANLRVVPNFGRAKSGASVHSIPAARRLRRARLHYVRTCTRYSHRIHGPMIYMLIPRGRRSLRLRKLSPSRINDFSYGAADAAHRDKRFRVIREKPRVGSV